MRMDTRRLFGASGLTLLISPCCLSTVRGELTAYEGFDYSPSGSYVGGLAGGEGFSGGWSGSSYCRLGEGSLAFGDLPASGNHVRCEYPSPGPSVGTRRTLADPISADEETTRYFSILLRPDKVPSMSLSYSKFHFGLVLDGDDVLDASDVFIGKPGSGSSGNYVVEPYGGGANQVASDAEVVEGETTLLVLKAEFHAAPTLDVFTLYVNPDSLGVEPSSGAVLSMAGGGVARLAVFSQSTVYDPASQTVGFSLDEIRVGTTYADVVGVPEPSTWALLGMGLLVLAFRQPRPRG